MYDAVGAKPSVERFSSWGSGKELIYKCSHCGTSFAILGNKEAFCHGCGKKIDWAVIRKVNKDISDLYWAKSFTIENSYRFQRAVCLAIDALNTKITNEQDAEEIIKILETENDKYNGFLEIVKVYFSGGNTK